MSWTIPCADLLADGHFSEKWCFAERNVRVRSIFPADNPKNANVTGPGVDINLVQWGEKAAPKIFLGLQTLRCALMLMKRNFDGSPMRFGCQFYTFENVAKI